MTEANSWGTVRRYLSPFGRLVRVENRIGTGTPDVHYTLRGFGQIASGWLETKATVASLTRDQVLWAAAERSAGGRSFLLMKNGTVWALYDPGGIAWLLSLRDNQSLRQGRNEREWIRERALLWTTEVFPTREVLRHLILGD